MGRSLKYDIPGDDWRLSALDFFEAASPEALDFSGPVAEAKKGGARSIESLFAQTLEPPFEVVLEIGFGRGEFLLDLAARFPGTAFLGVEVSFKRVLKLARKLARAGLTNVRLLEARAENVVRDLLPAESLDEVWINFSDPWPKARHEGRRLIQPAFVSELTQCMKWGGQLHVATDDVPYAEQIAIALKEETELTSGHPSHSWLPEVPGRMHTGYEEEWRAAGRPLHFFEYRRRSEVIHRISP
ncbi:MAG: tRNA (guanosine(46)-N7)-methyltransferase TrmB [bacterium TMED88]|nr:tRNA (guanosine(46)-N7)-methyltransferase TrmB [Deltaproteobacteria bacterium]OUV29935.1 MAG: tRNA (guanosine(46)-N7)-methyltransferase TrmB [bacterium TMED88]